MDLFAAVTTANVGATRIWSAVRLRKVSVWAVPFTSTSASQGTSEVSVEFNCLGSGGQFGSPPRKFTDVSMSPAKYAYVSASPDPHSLPGSWMNDDSDSPLFLLTVPIGGIVDLTLDFVLRNGETPVATRAITSGSFGVIGVLDMTSASATAGHLQAVDYARII